MYFKLFFSNANVLKSLSVLKILFWFTIKYTLSPGYLSLVDLIFHVFVCFVSCLSRIIATPIAHLLGVKASSRYHAVPNTILEKVFKSVSRSPDQKRLEGLAKQLDWSVRSVERWFRRRRNQERPTLLVKFRETW